LLSRSRYHQSTRCKLALQRFARFQDVVHQNDECAAFAAIAAELLAPRGFFLGVAAVDAPVAVAGLTAAFAFNRRIAGVLHSNLKNRGRGVPPGTLPPEKCAAPKRWRPSLRRSIPQKVSSLLSFRR
jgi:hypothetical protein